MNAESDLINLRSYESKFWASVNQKSNSECWIWERGLTKSGYGRFYIRPMSILSHRYSWIIHFGSIPDNIYVCHTCDNRSCVNPSHLFLGTASDNFKDMWRKGRRIFSEAELEKKRIVSAERTYSEETRERMRIAQRLRVQREGKRILSEEHREKVRQAHLGSKRSPEAKENLRKGAIKGWETRRSKS